MSASGDEVVELDLLARLLGVEPRIMRAEWEMQRVTNPDLGFVIPGPWVEQGRRRVRRVAEQMGCSDIGEIVRRLTGDPDGAE